MWIEVFRHPVKCPKKTIRPMLTYSDECHRGSAKEDSRWRRILEYFMNATQIGMTATPKVTKEEWKSYDEMNQTIIDSMGV